MKECRRKVELEGKLSKVLSGQGRPADAAERAELASVAGRKGLPAAAAHLFAEAFAEQPALADDLAASRRYNAARFAARALVAGRAWTSHRPVRLSAPAPRPGPRLAQGRPGGMGQAPRP